jgi:hypothetical protein
MGHENHGGNLLHQGPVNRIGVRGLFLLNLAEEHVCGGPEGRVSKKYGGEIEEKSFRFGGAYDIRALRFGLRNRFDAPRGDHIPTPKKNLWRRQRLGASRVSRSTAPNKGSAAHRVPLPTAYSTEFRTASVGSICGWFRCDLGSGRRSEVRPLGSRAKRTERNILRNVPLQTIIASHSQERGKLLSHREFKRYLSACGHIVLILI